MVTKHFGALVAETAIKIPVLKYLLEAKSSFTRLNTTVALCNQRGYCLAYAQAFLSLYRGSSSKIG